MRVRAILVVGCMSACVLAGSAQVEAQAAPAPAEPAPTQAEPAPAQPAPAQPVSPAPVAPATAPPAATVPPPNPFAPEAPAAATPATSEAAAPVSPVAPPPPAASEQSPTPDHAAAQAVPAEPPAILAPPEPNAEHEGGALGTRVIVDEWPRESREPAPRAYRGFSARLSAALGYANAIRDLDAAPTEVTGLDGSLALDLGGTLSDNLIAYGRLGGFALNHASEGDSPNAGSAFFALAGAGARYHFLPLDWYASGTLALVLMSVTNDVGKADNAEPGFGFQLETGKQWPAGSGANDVSIGLGLRASYVRCSSSGDVDEPWIGKALSVVFSTSYH